MSALDTEMEGSQTAKCAQNSKHQTQSEVSTATTDETDAGAVSTGGATDNRSTVLADRSPAQESDTAPTSVLIHSQVL